MLYFQIDFVAFKVIYGVLLVQIYTRLKCLLVSTYPFGKKKK